VGSVVCTVASPTYRPIFSHPPPFPLHCGDAMLHTAYHNMAVCRASPSVLAPYAAHNTHPLPSSASTELLRYRAQPGEMDLRTSDSVTHDNAVCQWRTAPDVV
jgi:hypothetical protein